MFIGCLTSDSVIVINKLGVLLGPLVLSVCALKCLRCSFSQQSNQYNILAFAVLFFQLDYLKCSETFIIDYYFTAIAYDKIYEFLLKVIHFNIISLLCKYLQNIYYILPVFKNFIL